MTDHGADLDAILERAEAAGLVETYVDAEGRLAMRLTPDGERVAATRDARRGRKDALITALLSGGGDE
jgi:DNA-binding MarR family transcriptional regulator